MKRLMLIIPVLFCCHGLFGQKAKELRIQMEQLLKIKMQLGLVKDKNKNDRRGLDQIGSEKNGTYDLYKKYFGSLRTVNGNVRNNEKVQDIRDIFSQIRRIFPMTIDSATNSGLYEQTEIAYFNGVYDRVHKDCTDIISNLNKVTSNGQLEMTDDERLKRIDQLYERMVAAYMFTRKFCSDIDNVRRARQQVKRDVQKMKKLYGQE